jgi:hypothetical protein
VRCPRVRDRVGEGGEHIRFSSTILPPCARRSKSLEVLIPSARQTNGCGRAPPKFAPRWTVPWKSRENRRPPSAPAGPGRVAPIPHQLIIICRARFRRSFDEMPSRTSLARQGSLYCRRSLKQRDDGFGISPRSGLSGQTRRQLAIVNHNPTGGFPHVCCTVILIPITLGDAGH